MATAAAEGQRKGSRAGPALRARLDARRSEIEAAALTRVSAISDPSEVTDPAYVEGLRVAVRAAISYGIDTTGREGADLSIPVALLAQARMAARVGIPLGTVLRRYFAGYSLLSYFILEEASLAGITGGTELQRLLGAHAGVFDRLVAAVGEEYGREADVRVRPNDGHGHAKRIAALVDGESWDTTDIRYDFEAWHLGLITYDSQAEAPVRALGAKLGCVPLIVYRDDGALWAWLGACRRRNLDEVESHLADFPPTVRIAAGEPAQGLAGWRLTHRQAAAALLVAQRRADRFARYADVALLACTLRDDLLVTSLRDIYLAPLEGGVGDSTLPETAHAYFAADHKVSSAAAMLGVSRQTVTNRLRSVERILGVPLSSCAAEIEVALRLERLRAPDRGNDKV